MLASLVLFLSPHALRLDSAAPPPPTAWHWWLLLPLQPSADAPAAPRPDAAAALNARDEEEARGSLLPSLRPNEEGASDAEGGAVERGGEALARRHARLEAKPLSRAQLRLLAFLGLYCAFHLLWPLRHLLIYARGVSWHEEAHGSVVE